MFPMVQQYLKIVNDLGLVPFVSLNTSNQTSVSEVNSVNRLTSVEKDSNSLSFIPQLCIDQDTGYMKDDVTGVYYTLNRLYIGTRPVTVFLKALDIDPELALPSHLVCSVGYSKKLNEWVAWNLTGADSFCSREAAVSWVNETSNVNIDRYCSLDKMFASAVITSRVFFKALDCYFGNITESLPVAEYKEQNLDKIFEHIDLDLDKIFENCNEKDSGAFNEMVEPLLALFKQKDVEKSKFISDTARSANPLYYRISGEHRQHNRNMPKQALTGQRHSGAHYQHNVPTDSNLTKPHTGIKIGIKRSGDHVQHNHTGPTFSSLNNESFVSESAEDPTKYEWYRYVPVNGRSISLKGYHKEFDQASIDDTEVYGIRQIRGKEEFYLTFGNAQDFGILFRVPTALVNRAIKNSKTYKGKVPLGRAVKPVDVKEVKPSQVKEKVNKIVPKTEKPLTIKERREAERQRLLEESKNKRLQPQVRDQVIRPDGKINLSDIDAINVKSRDVTYLGLYQQSIFSDDYHVVINDERDELYSNIMSEITRGKNSNPIAYLFRVRTSQDWVAPYLGVSANKMRMNSAIVKRIIASNKHEVIKGIKNVANFDEKPELPKASKFKRAEPIYYGNNFAVLSEIKSAILQGYFTKAFKVTDIKNRKSVTIDDEKAKNDPHFGIESTDTDEFMLVLSAQNNNPFYQHEADEILQRLSRIYGPTIRTVVKESKTSEGKLMMFVVIRLALKKVSDEHLHRSKALHDLVRNNLNNKQQVQKGSDFVEKLDTLKSEFNKLYKKYEQEKIQVSAKRSHEELNLKTEIDKLKLQLQAKGTANVRPILDKHDKLVQQLSKLPAKYDDMLKTVEDIYSEEISRHQREIRVLTKSHSLNFKNQLIFNMPVYKAKFGQTLVSVEVVDYNIPDGTVGVRIVRGGDRTVHYITNLYSFFDEEKVFP
jgi:hypothetical protein